MSSDSNNFRASTSFKDDELLALDAILSIVRRGGDARTIARQPAAVRAAAKVVRMREAIELQAANTGPRPRRGEQQKAVALTKGGDA